MKMFLFYFHYRPCSTTAGKLCVFPFTYNGVENYGCTEQDSPDRSYRCSTAAGTLAWGTCTLDCF